MAATRRDAIKISSLVENYVTGIFSVGAIRLGAEGIQHALAPTFVWIPRKPEGDATAVACGAILVAALVGCTVMLPRSDQNESRVGGRSVWPVAAAHVQYDFRPGPV